MLYILQPYLMPLCISGIIIRAALLETSLNTHYFLIGIALYSVLLL